jgi:2-enoate reductase
VKEYSSFPRLFNPVQIGNLKLKNHIVMLPMGISFAGVNGEVTSHTIDYFSERAKGGVGYRTRLGFIDGRHP